MGSPRKARRLKPPLESPPTAVIVPPTKTVHIRTWGCQMNVYDSQRMLDVLSPHGYRPADSPDGADMVILNTCHIREKATEKLFSELGRLKAAKDAKAQNGGRMILAVAGCVAQAEGAIITERASHVDIVVGSQSYQSLPELVARVSRAAGQKAIDTDFPVEPKFDRLPQENAPHGASAYLAVQEGCDKFCSFCVVPYTRGAEYSRPANDILAEARRMARGGATEITLLGQNVNAYHGEGPTGATWGLGRLIRAVADIEGIARIRYMTSHPVDMDDDLIAAHGDTPSLMPFVHLPVQSGSDAVLRRMNRRHSVAHYRDIVAKIRAARPDIAISSDFIVGSPGEGDRDFQATLELVSEIGFAQAYSFKYSPRPGTPAAVAGDQVAEPVKAERLALLQSAILDGQSRFNRGSVGQTMLVLLDGFGRRPGQLHGRSPYMQAVQVDAPKSLLGKTVPIYIEKARALSLSGRLAPEALDSRQEVA